MGSAICHRCGAEKDLPLGRCAGCGVLPSGSEREDALLCSSLFLDDAALTTLQARIRRGEPLQPSPALRLAARERLTTTPAEPAALTVRQQLLLGAANIVFTPLLGWAVWFRYRSRPGPGATQALLVTVPVTVVMTVGVVAWRVWGLAR